MQRKLNLINLTSINYNIRAIHLSIYLKLNQNIIHIKNEYTKIRITCDTSHIQKSIQKDGLSESDTPKTNTKSHSHSIPSTMP